MIYEQPSTEQQVSQWGLKGHLKHLLLISDHGLVALYVHFLFFFMEKYIKGPTCAIKVAPQKVASPSKVIHSEQT